MITVVGAGPAGSFSAYLLAKAGFEVRVLEEHSRIGEPVACTGVVTGDVLSQRLKLPKELIINRIGKARITAPDNASVEVRLKNDIIIDRAGFDRHLAGMAKDAGAEYSLNHRFEGLSYSNGNGKKNKIIAVVKNKIGNEAEKFETDYLVGADGPLSQVARSAGLYGSRKFYVGMQATMKLENDNLIRFFPSEDGIAWVVPENERVARVGIAARANARECFKRFAAAVAGKNYEKKILGKQAGPIPIYNPGLRTATRDGRILLVGDAATMVKASTLGGINQGLVGAEAVAAAITGKGSYERLWRKRMGMDLYLSLLMRRAMERFTNKNYDQLVDMFREGKNRQLLEKYDRDEPTRFALKLLVSEPRLLLLARKAWF